MIVNRFRNPMTRKRIMRFKEVKRAYFSLWILAAFYLFSLGSELICNNTPLYIKHNGRSYFPIFRFYPEATFVKNGKKTRPDYKKINSLAQFQNNAKNFMIFPPFPYGPYESIDPKSIPLADHVSLLLIPRPVVGTVNIGPNYAIKRWVAFNGIIDKNGRDFKGLPLSNYFGFPEEIKAAVAKRFANQKAARVSSRVKRIDGKKFEVSLSTYTPRSKKPGTIRLTFREVEPVNGAGKVNAARLTFNRKLKIVEGPPGIWGRIPMQEKKNLIEMVESRFSGPLDSYTIKIDSRQYKVDFFKKDVSFPYAPVKDHPMGIDAGGRDVLARVLYGLRTSMTFGMLLVVCSMALGIIAGALQGYYGGIPDITGQRLIEIWSALPFLYIMILMGSVYGRSFSILLFCYGLFNWIGISYYIRAEFLRLRKQAFVEAAKCMGISTRKVIFKHILPNALVPVITFFPFSLVGAIGALAALDYLGFGLPPPTPSWGELLFQAQQFRWAWWLILYPSLALFLVMLFGVFIGEGMRNAYDPKRYTRLE